MLKGIIPRFGVPESISYNNGIQCIAEIVPVLSKVLQVKWEAHIQKGNGKNESGPHTAKLCQETHLKQTGIAHSASANSDSPFEIECGKGYLTNSLNAKGDQMHTKVQAIIKQHLMAISQTFFSLHRSLKEQAWLGHTGSPVPTVFVQTRKANTLEVEKP